MTCPCRELEELRRYKCDAQKLLRAKEKDLILLARRCAALSETLKAAVKERK